MSPMNDSSQNKPARPATAPATLRSEASPQPNNSARWIQPDVATLLLASIHLFGALCVSILLMWSSLDNLAEGIAAWGIASVLLLIPLSSVAAMSHRIERVQTSFTSVQPQWWLLYAIGVTQLAHWLPACLWSPVLAMAAFGGRTERRLEAALITLLAWIAAGLALGLAVGAQRALARRRFGEAKLRPVVSALIPSSAVLAVSYGAVCFVPSVLWLTWLSDAWGRGAGATGMFSFSLFTIAAALLAGGFVGAWLLASSPLAPSAARGARMRQIEFAAAVFTTHWLLLFPAMLIETGYSDDMRFSMLFCSFFAILVGTSVWSIARTSRSLAVQGLSWGAQANQEGAHGRP